MNTKDSEDVCFESLPHLGQLFLQAQLISKDQLAKVGGAVDAPPPRLGQKLVIAGAISHAELHDALQIQCLLREHCIEKAQALKALKLVREKEITAEEALGLLGIQSAPTTRLGELLLDSGIIDSSQLEDALSRAATTNLPLGSVLLMSKIISADLLSLATDAQAAVRRNALTRESAINALAEALAQESAPVSPGALVTALAAAVPKPAPTEKTSAGADVPQANAAAKPDKLPPSEPRDIRFTEFLILCGILQPEDVQRAQKMRDGTNFGIDTVVKKLHSSKNVMVELAGYCYKQVQVGAIDLDRAIYAFDYCKRLVEDTECSATDAAARLAADCGIKVL